MTNTTFQASQPSADAGLHEFVDVEFTITALDTPAKEKIVIDALKDLPSVRSLSIAKGKVSFTYEPVLFSRRKLLQAIACAGFQIADIEAAPASALIDAFLEAENKNAVQT